MIPKPDPDVSWSPDLIYLDNAATTFPKPPEVLRAMMKTYACLGVSPGRGGYDLAMEAADLVHQARRKLAVFFGAPDPNRVVFAGNATEALNLAILGRLRPGDHAIASRLDHNSVLRPLHHLQERGWIQYDLMGFDPRGYLDPDDLTALFRPETRLVVLPHASNVLGTIQPIEEIGKICQKRNIPLLLDSAQSAGLIPVSLTGSGASAIAFTGHKSLFGPTGIGGLVLDPKLDIEITCFGGTGVDSLSPWHTREFPHRLEAGTLNLLGIIGLSLGLDFVLEIGLAALHAHEMALWERLRQGLAEHPPILLYGSQSRNDRLAVLAANIRGMHPSDLAAVLDADFNIAVRSGLHCAPLVHEDLQTAPHGSVRFSPGWFNTPDHIDQAIEAMASIAGSR